jgi:Ca2+-binding RTX toxin-like protein
MTIVAALTGPHRIILDLSDETDGNYLVFGSDGADVITGGQGDDIIHGGLNLDHIYTGGGHDTVFGGVENDRINVGNKLGAGDFIDGGTGRDTLEFDGNSSGTVLDAETVTGIESLFFEAGHDYTVTFAEGLVRSFDEPIFVAAGNLLEDDVLNFNAKNVTEHGFSIVAGQGNDVVVGSREADVVAGRRGADTMTGGAGGDIFVWDEVEESLGGAFDTIKGFDAEADFLQPDFVNFDGTVDGVDAPVAQGKLNADNIHKGLKKAIGAFELGADHAVLFRPDEGSLAGKYFLIVDGNGAAGYQTNDDLVVQLANPKNIENLGIEDFGGPL